MSTLAEVRLWGKTIGAVSLEYGEDVASFEYEAAFAQSGIQVAPIVLPLSRRVYRFPELSRATFFGLPGLLADSLPDTSPEYITRPMQDGAHVLGGDVQLVSNRFRSLTIGVSQLDDRSRSPIEFAKAVSQRFHLMTDARCNISPGLGILIKKQRVADQPIPRSVSAMPQNLKLCDPQSPG